MKNQQISNIKKVHYGEDIYVLGSGPSMNHFNKAFFTNKIVIGVNRICRFFKCDYTVLKDPKGLTEILSTDQHGLIIASKYAFGNKSSGILNNTNNCDYIFDHLCNNTNKDVKVFNPDLSVIADNSDRIIVSHSTITSALHIAAYMGAKNIFLCGHDCCEINGNAWIDGYYDNIKPVHKDKVGYTKWLNTIKIHSTCVKEAIQNNFDCNIFELTPVLFKDIYLN